MGAIVDASVVDEVFGSNRTEAGEQFFNWIAAGKGILMVGGKILREFDQTSYKRRGIKRWVRQAILAGNVREVQELKINTLTASLWDNRVFKSNDPHVLALAQASGARLLYCNDKTLQQDFKNKKLIDQPRGKVYSTNEYKDRKFQEKHKILLLELENGNLCGTPQ